MKDLEMIQIIVGVIKVVPCDLRFWSWRGNRGQVQSATRTYPLFLLLPILTVGSSNLRIKLRKKIASFVLYMKK